MPDSTLLSGRAALGLFGFFARIAAGLVFLLFRGLELVFKPVIWLHDKAWGFVERSYPKASLDAAVATAAIHR